MASKDTYLHNEALESSNRKLIYIFLLNLLDGLLTYAGVSKGYVLELNLLMTKAVSSFEGLLTYKLVLPSVTLLFAAYMMNRFNHVKMPIATLFISICFWAYLWVLLAHFLWIGRAFYHLIS